MVHLFDIYGWWLGYPVCCTNEFIKLGRIIPDNQRKAANKTGFIPCQKHAEDVLSGKCTLESLITNRYHNYSFPNDTDLPNEYELKQLYCKRMLY